MPSGHSAEIPLQTEPATVMLSAVIPKLRDHHATSFGDGTAAGSNLQAVMSPWAIGESSGALHTAYSDHRNGYVLLVGAPFAHRCALRSTKRQLPPSDIASTFLRPEGIRWHGSRRPLQPKLFGPSAFKTANKAAIPNSPALSIMEWGCCQRTSDPR
jgi:hypothetical protein